MAFVYWIRKPEHSDFMSEGYVGVTNTSLEQRIYEHEKSARLGGKKSYVIHKAIKKYGMQNLVASVLVEASEDYCYEVEYKIRPEASIGWNILPGGQRPPSRKGTKLTEEQKAKISWKGKKRSAESVARSAQSRRGFKHSEKSRLKMSESRLGSKQSEETVNKRIEKVRGQLRSDEQKERMSRARLNLLPWFRKPTPYEAWAFADKVMEMWSKDLSPYKIAKELSISISVVRNMIKLFDEDWFPANDEVWLKEFKNKESIHNGT